MRSRNWCVSRNCMAALSMADFVSADLLGAITLAATTSRRRSDFILSDMTSNLLIMRQIGQRRPLIYWPHPKPTIASNTPNGSKPDLRCALLEGPLWPVCDRCCSVHISALRAGSRPSLRFASRFAVQKSRLCMLIRRPTSSFDPSTKSLCLRCRY